MRISICLICLFLILGCATSSKDAFPNWHALDSFQRDWYSRQLTAADEKPILLPIRAPVYRFTWLRSFHHPIIIRVECPDRCSLEAIELSGAGGYKPGSILIRKKHVLTAEEKKTFSNLFEKINFWFPQPESDVIGSDGAQWILEAASENIYQAWQVWEPTVQPRFKTYFDFCDFLISLSGLEIPDDDFY